MVYRSSTEGGYGTGASVSHVDASHADRIDIPDAELLFRGHFARSGPDLVLTGQDGHRLVVTGYFASEKHPDLVAPNGAHLSGDLVDLLAGSPTHGQYAQAGTTLPPEAIGKVEKVVGHVTLIHNGVAGPLHVGDPVYKTDVVETGANSSAGIAFPDGTALDLVNNTRMALNEYNFEPNGASNGAIFSLVEGTFAFVAGQVAHTGQGMKINTPVATMGIRGTVGLFRSEPTVVNSRLGHVWSVFLHEDIDGSHHLGRIALIDQDPTSPTFGQIFYLLDSSEYIAYLEPQGSGLPPLVRLEPITNSKLFDDRHFFDDLGQILNSYNNANPQSIPGIPGSGDDPNGLLLQPQLFPEDGGRPLFNFVSLTPGSGTPPQLIFGGLPIMGGLFPNTNTPNGPTTNGATSNIFIWLGGTGLFDLGPDWTPGTSPNSPADIVEIPSGTVTYDNNLTIGTLYIGPNGTLDIVGGSLTVLNGVTDDGAIVVQGDPPALTINGPVMVGSTGSFTATGSGDEILFANGTVDNHGTIAALNQGEVLFQSEMVTNENGAKIVTDNGSIEFDGGGVTNKGRIGAKDHGVITFESIGGNPIDVTNLAGATIEAKDRGQIEFVGANSGGQVDNQGGTIKATHHGIITFDDIAVTNETHGLIEAKDGGTVVFKDVAGDANGGFFNYGTVAAIGCGSEVDFYHTDINGGTLKADGGKIFVSSDSSFFGSVNVLISGGGLADLADTVSDTAVTVTFSAAGALELAHSLGGVFGGTIENFGAGDAIILDDLAFSKGEYAIWCKGILTIYECGKIEDTIKISGDYNANSFAIIDDGGKTEVVFASDEWIGPSPEDRTGTWTTASNWGDDIVPNSALNAIVDLPGRYTITTSGDQGANSLTITDVDATLEGSGKLAFGTFENYGTIKVVDHEHLVLQFENGTNYGAIKAVNGTLSLDGGTFDDGGGAQLFNYGRVLAADHGKINFDGVTVFNDTTPLAETESSDEKSIPGKIDAIGCGATILFSDGAELFNQGIALAKGGGQIDFLRATVDNDAGGKIEAGRLGTLSFVKTSIDNETDATIEAVGHGARVIIRDSGLTNTGILLAADCGSAYVDDSKVYNQSGGEIDARDGGTITFDSVFLTNSPASLPGEEESLDGNPAGEILARDGGTIKIANSIVLNGGKIEAERYGRIWIDHAAMKNTGIIEAVGLCSAVILSCDLIYNTGTVLAKDAGAVEVSDSKVFNRGAGEIEARDCGSVVAFCHDSITNKHGAEILATDFGTITFDDDTIANKHDSTIEATKGGLVQIEYSDVINKHDSVIKATDWGTVTLADDCVTNTGGSTIEAKGHHSTVDLEHTFVMNDGGTIAAIGRDAVVNLFDTTIVGGTLETRHGGIIETPNGTSTLESVTLAGGRFETSEFSFIDLKGTTTIDGRVTFEGGGTFKLEGAGAEIVGDAGMLDNYSTIVGAGQIGNDNLILVNEPSSTDPNHSAGVIDADVAHQKLIIDTGGNPVTNGGLLEATDQGILVLDGAVDNSGTIQAHDGTIIVRMPGGDDFISAQHGGIVTITDDSVGAIDGSAFGAGDRIYADGRGSSVTIENGSNFANCDTVDATCGATVTVTGGASFGSHDRVYAADSESTLTVKGTAPVFGNWDSLYATGDSALTIDGSSFGNYDNVYATADSTLTVENGSTFANCDTVDATCGATLIITGGAKFGSDDHVYATDSESTLTVKGTALVFGDGDSVYATGDSTLTVDGSSFGNYDTVYTTGDSTLIVENGSAFADCDTVDATCGSSTTITGGAQFGSNDQVYADGGSTLLINDLGSDFGNHDSIYATGDSHLTLDGSSFGDDVSIAVTDGGKLTIDGSSFGDGDSIGLSGGAVTIDGKTASGYGALSGSIDDLTTVDANTDGRALVLDNGGATIKNNGLFEATNGGILDVDSVVNNAHGSILVGADSRADFADSVTGGSATIEGGKLEFDASSSVNVAFDGTTGTPYGELVLKDWAQFSGTISDLSGTGEGNSDEVDLVDFTDGTIKKETTSGSGANETVTLKLEDSDHATITLTFKDPDGTLAVEHTGNDTIIYDPPAAGSSALATGSSNPSVSIGGAGNDTFVFAPGIGSETLSNFNPQNDAIELDHFGNAQSMQELAALITTDAHGDAAIEFGHGDSIAIPGMTASYLQAHLQSLVHLH